MSRVVYVKLYLRFINANYNRKCIIILIYYRINKILTEVKSADGFSPILHMQEINEKQEISEKEETFRACRFYFKTHTYLLRLIHELSYC